MLWMKSNEGLAFTTKMKFIFIYLFLWLYEILSNGVIKL